MKLNGSTRPTTIYRKMKWISTMNKEGELNICYLALDKHIQDGYGDQVANI
jgi:propionyl-CoA synthetase